ncbi:major intrinsic protein [Ditylenchus destructor]|nr:major intrinsic protein [Ditylenchus destructor]
MTAVAIDNTPSRLLLFQRKYRISNKLWRNVLCEFVSTTFLMYTGFSVNAQTVLSRFQMNAYVGLAIGWGFCLIFSVQMAYRITGSHLNPAVSFFIFTFGQLPLSHLLLYTVAQTMGAFLGASMTFILYYEKITEFDGGVRSVTGPNATAGIFATYPGDHLSVAGAMLDQIACTATMCFIVGIVTDERNKIPKWAHPTLLGVMLTTMCLGFGLNAGNAMNPARDFGPRLFTLIAGYGWQVFSYRDWTWFWIPIIAPIIGAFIGAWLYQLLISIQIPDDEDEDHHFTSRSFETSQLDLLNTTNSSPICYPKSM